MVVGVQLLALACLVLMGSVRADEGVRMVTVDGVGAVLRDVGAARDEAIRDGLRLAVEQALGTSVVGRTLMVDFQVVEDRVIGRAEGFVRSYRVVREQREGDSGL